MVVSIVDLPRVGSIMSQAGVSGYLKVSQQEWTFTKGSLVRGRSSITMIKTEWHTALLRGGGGQDESSWTYDTGFIEKTEWTDLQQNRFIYIGGIYAITWLRPDMAKSIDSEHFDGW